MKLLICTQYSDPNDPVMGFFARWIEEFKKHCEVEVISRKDLGGGGRVLRAWRLLRLIRKKEYDAVFVHMNPEYVIVVGIPWHMQGKKVGFWYTHKAVNLRLRLAAHGADIIFTASPESFRLKSNKVRVMGHGIDTSFFSPDPAAVRNDSVLSVGRLMKSKRHDLAIRALQYVHKDLYIAGEGPELERLQALAEKLQVGNRVHFLGGLTQAQLRDLYRRCGVLAHTSETGSLDKVVLEALACGLPVVTTSKSLSGIPLTVAEPTPQAIAALLEKPQPADTEYVKREHSLQNLIARIIAAYRE